MRTFLAAAILLPGAFGQTAATFTRSFDAEVFPNQSPYTCEIDGLGINDLGDLGSGSLQLLTIDLEVRWQFEVQYTNDTGIEGVLGYHLPAVIYASNPGDCAAYSFAGVYGQSESLQPGETGTLLADVTHVVNWSGSNFSPACSGPEWLWSNLYCRNDYCCSDIFYGPIGPVFPTDFTGMATITGTITAEWAPEPLPHWSVCDGNATTPTTLTPAGDWDNLWLTQTGVPADQFNLLIRNTTASNVIPPNGLCITQGGGAFSRIDGSLSQWAPCQLGFVPSLSGTVHCF